MVKPTFIRVRPSLSNTRSSFLYTHVLDRRLLQTALKNFEMLLLGSYEQNIFVKLKIWKLYFTNFLQFQMIEQNNVYIKFSFSAATLK